MILLALSEMEVGSRAERSNKQWCITAEREREREKGMEKK